MIFAYVDYAVNITKVTPDQVIFNVTSSSDDVISLLIPIIAALVGAFIAGIIAIIMARSQTRLQELSADYQQRHLDLTSTLEVFKILNNHKHRLAREIVYCAYKSDDEQVFDREPYHSAAAMVRADMDQVGVLIEDGLLDENKFLKMYWNTVLLVWRALEKDIIRERSIRKYDNYMTKFEKLSNSARKYRIDNALGSEDPDIYQGKDCVEKFNGFSLDNMLK